MHEAFGYPRVRVYNAPLPKIMPAYFEQYCITVCIAIAQNVPARIIVALHIQRQAYHGGDDNASDRE